MSIAEKLITVAENVPKVYEAGKKAQYDEFWDSIPENPDGTYLFSGDMWNDITFKPKHNIVPKNGANGLFYNNACTNIKKTLNDCGVKLDLSRVTGMNNGFSYSNTTELPELDLSGMSTINSLFSNARQLVTIDGVILKDGATFSGVFANCESLENITIMGTVSKNGFDIHWSTLLSAASLKSIIDALSTETSGLAITLPTTAQATYDSANGDGAWAQLVATKANWTVAYA